MNVKQHARYYRYAHPALLSPSLVSYLSFFSLFFASLHDKDYGRHEVNPKRLTEEKVLRVAR